MATDQQAASSSASTGAGDGVLCSNEEVDQFFTGEGRPSGDTSAIVKQMEGMQFPSEPLSDADNLLTMMSMILFEKHLRDQGGMLVEYGAKVLMDVACRYLDMEAARSGAGAEYIEPIKRAVRAAIVTRDSTADVLYGKKFGEHMAKNQDIPVVLMERGSSTHDRHAVALVVVRDDADGRVAVINSGYKSAAGSSIMVYKRAVSMKQLEHGRFMHYMMDDARIRDTTDDLLRIVHLAVLGHEPSAARFADDVHKIEEAVDKTRSALPRAMKMQWKLKSNTDLGRVVLGPRAVKNAAHQIGGSCVLYSLAYMFGHAIALLDRRHICCMPRLWVVIRLHALYYLTHMFLLGVTASTLSETGHRSALLISVQMLLSGLYPQYSEAKLTWPGIGVGDGRPLSVVNALKRADPGKLALCLASIYPPRLDISDRDTQYPQPVSGDALFDTFRDTIRSIITLKPSDYTKLIHDAIPFHVDNVWNTDQMYQVNVYKIFMLRKMLRDMYKTRSVFVFQDVQPKTFAVNFGMFCLDVRRWQVCAPKSGLEDIYVLVLLTIFRTFKDVLAKEVVPLDITRHGKHTMRIRMHESLEMAWNDAEHIDMHEAVDELNRYLGTLMPWVAINKHDVIITNARSAQGTASYEYLTEITAMLTQIINFSYNSIQPGRVTYYGILYDCVMGNKNDSIRSALNFVDSSTPDVVTIGIEPNEIRCPPIANLLGLVGVAPRNSVADDPALLLPHWDHLSFSSNISGINILPRFDYSHRHAQPSASASAASSSSSSSSATALPRTDSQLIVNGCMPTTHSDHDDILAVQHMLSCVLDDAKRCGDLLGLPIAVLCVFVQIAYCYRENKELTNNRAFMEVLQRVHDFCMRAKQKGEGDHAPSPERYRFMALYGLITRDDALVAQTNALSRSQAMLGSFVAKLEHEHAGDFEGLMKHANGVLAAVPNLERDAREIRNLALECSVLTKDEIAIDLCSSATLVASNVVCVPTGRGRFLYGTIGDTKYYRSTNKKLLIYTQEQVSGSSSSPEQLPAGQLRGVFLGGYLSAATMNYYKAQSTDRGGFTYQGMVIRFEDGSSAALSSEYSYFDTEPYDKLQQLFSDNPDSRQLLSLFGSGVSHFSYEVLVRTDGSAATTGHPSFVALAPIGMRRAVGVVHAPFADKESVDAMIFVPYVIVLGSSEDRYRMARSSVSPSGKARLSPLYSHWFSGTKNAAIIQHTRTGRWFVLHIVNSDHTPRERSVWHPVGTPPRGVITDRVAADYALTEIHPTGLWLVPVPRYADVLAPPSALGAFPTSDLATQMQLGKTYCVGPTQLGGAPVFKHEPFWRDGVTSIAFERPRAVRDAIEMASSVTRAIRKLCSQKPAYAAYDSVPPKNKFIDSFKGCCVIDQQASGSETESRQKFQEPDAASTVATIRAAFAELPRRIGTIRDMLLAYTRDDKVRMRIALRQFRFVDPGTIDGTHDRDAYGNEIAQSQNDKELAKKIVSAGRLVLSPAELIVAHGACLREWCYAHLALALIDDTLSRLAAKISQSSAQVGTKDSQLPPLFASEVLYALELLDDSIVHNGAITVPDMLAELNSGFLIRTEQVDLTRRIVASYGNYPQNSTAYRMLMGSGKSSFITPWLVYRELMMSVESRAVVAVPAALLDQTYSSILAASRLFGNILICTVTSAPAPATPAFFSLKLAPTRPALGPKAQYAVGSDDVDMLQTSDPDAGQAHQTYNRDFRQYKVVRESDPAFVHTYGAADSYEYGHSRYDDYGHEQDVYYYDDDDDTADVPEPAGHTLTGEDAPEYRTDEYAVTPIALTDADRREFPDDDDDDDGAAGGKVSAKRKRAEEQEQEQDYPRDAQKDVSDRVAGIDEIKGPGGAVIGTKISMSAYKLHKYSILVASDKDMQSELLFAIHDGHPQSEWMEFMKGALVVFDEVDMMTDALKCETNVSLQQSTLGDIADTVVALVDALDCSMSVTEDAASARHVLEKMNSSVPALVKKYGAAVAMARPDTGEFVLNKTYGFGDVLENNADNHMIAVPYSSANTPINGSRFTDMELTIVLTYMCYRHMLLPQSMSVGHTVFRAEDMQFLGFIAKRESIDLAIKMFSACMAPQMIEALREYCVPDQYAVLDTNGSGAHAKFAAALAALAVPMRRTFLRIYFAEVAKRFITYHTTERNVGMLEFMSPLISTRRAMFSGTLNIPNYAADRHIAALSQAIDAEQRSRRGGCLPIVSTYPAKHSADGAAINPSTTETYDDAFVLAMLSGFRCSDARLCLLPAVHIASGTDKNVIEREIITLFVRQNQTAAAAELGSIPFGPLAHSDSRPKDRTSHQQAATKSYSALIDASGALRTYSAETFAQMLAACCPGRPVFFVQAGVRSSVTCHPTDARAQQLPTDGLVGRLFELASAGRPLAAAAGCAFNTARYSGQQCPDNSIYFYDQRSTIGIDFKQPKYVHGLLIVDNKTTYTGASQAVFRLRKLARGHTFDYFVVARSMAHSPSPIAVGVVSVPTERPTSGVVDMLLRREDELMRRLALPSRQAMALAMIRMHNMADHGPFEQQIFNETHYALKVRAGMLYDDKQLRSAVVTMHAGCVEKWTAGLDAKSKAAATALFATVHDRQSVSDGALFVGGIKAAIATAVSSATDVSAANDTAVAYDFSMAAEVSSNVVHDLMFDISHPISRLMTPTIGMHTDKTNEILVKTPWLAHYCHAASTLYGVNVTSGAIAQLLRDVLHSNKTKQPLWIPLFVLAVVTERKKSAPVAALFLISHYDALSYMGIPEHIRHARMPSTEYCIYGNEGRQLFATSGLAAQPRPMLPLTLIGRSFAFSVPVPVSGPRAGQSLVSQSDRPSGTADMNSFLADVMRNFTLAGTLRAGHILDGRLAPLHIRHAVPRFITVADGTGAPLLGSTPMPPRIWPVITGVFLPTASGQLTAIQADSGNSPLVPAALQSCAVCGKSPPSLAVCSHCYAAAYCSAEHQRVHAPVHLA